MYFCRKCDGVIRGVFEETPKNYDILCKCNSNQTVLVEMEIDILKKAVEILRSKKFDITAQVVEECITKIKSGNLS